MSEIINEAIEINKLLEEFTKNRKPEDEESITNLCNRLDKLEYDMKIDEFIKYIAKLEILGLVN